MAEIRNVSKKRKIDELDAGKQAPSNKKIKIVNNTHDKENGLFLDLPPEVQHQILSFITDDCQRRHIRLVSRVWFDHINYNEFKIGVLLGSEADAFANCFGRYQKPISLKFMKVHYLNSHQEFTNSNLITAKQLKRAIKHLTQLTGLDLQLNSFELPKRLVDLQALTTIFTLRESIFTKLTNLTRLKTSKLFQSRQVAKFPPKLESLDYDSSSFKWNFTEPQTRLTELKISTVDNHLFHALSNLRKLEIRNPGPFFHNLSDASQLFPNLGELSTNVDVPELFGKNLTKLHWKSTTLLVIEGHLTQLKEIVADNIHYVDKSVLPSLETYIQNGPGSSILSHLDYQKITQLGVALDGHFDLFAKFTKLEELDLRLTSQTKGTPHPVPITTLKRLRLVYRYCSYPTQWMAQLPNLVNLSIQEIGDGKAIIDFKELKQLTSLQVQGYFKDINVEKLNNLVCLDIISARASLEPVEIRGISTLTNLTRLMCGHSFKKAAPITNWQDLSSMTSLQELRLHHIGDIASLITLQKLTYLDIYWCSTSLLCLTRLSRLQTVVVARKVDNQICQDLFDALPFCHTFTRN